MIDTVSRYLAEGFGGLEGCKSVRLSDSFPLVISAGYRFYRCRLMSTDCILAVAVEGAIHTPRKVQKQLAQVEAEFGVPVVFVKKVRKVPPVRLRWREVPREGDRGQDVLGVRARGRLGEGA